MSNQPSVDIIIPVYNSPNHARVCIDSVLKEATDPYRVILINDHCDSYTTSLLREYAKHQHVTLIEHENNIGYLKSVNQGIHTGDGEIVILLNSDAAISSGTLERIRSKFSSSHDIAVISAVSTWANWTRIPFPGGTNRLNLTDIVRSLGEDDLADIGNASGFFFAVKRKVYDQIGVFDEAYSPGYWEEADFCMRALAANFKVMVDRKLYVFHHGWGSFQQSGRDENMTKNRSVFMDRWSSQFKGLEQDWRKENPVNNLVNKLSEKLTLPDTERIRVFFIKKKADKKDFTPSLVELVNSLVNMGVDANIVFFEPPEDDFFNFTPMYFKPITLTTEKFPEELPACDFVIPVEISVAFESLAISNYRRQTEVILMCFSFELERFGFKSDLYQKADQCYRLIKHKVIMDKEKANLFTIYSDNKDIRVIGPSVNTDIFYPNERERKIRVVTHLESNTDPSERSFIVELYNEIINKSIGCELSWFGSLDKIPELPDSTIQYGHVAKMNEMATIFNECTFFVQASKSLSGRQFGLQAMGCGTISFLPFDNTPVTICKHLYNCFLMDTRDVGEVVQLLKEATENKNLRKKISSNAVEDINYINLLDNAESMKNILMKK